jgi:hypothetical protein
MHGREGIVLVIPGVRRRGGRVLRSVNVRVRLSGLLNERDGNAVNWHGRIAFGSLFVSYTAND